MPSRTYAGIDLNNYTIDNSDPNNPAFASIAFSNPTPGVSEATATGFDNNPVSGLGLEGYASFTGDFDFDAFPAIPDDAEITRVTYRRAFSINGTLYAQDPDALVVYDIASTLFRSSILGGVSLPNLSVVASGSQSDPTSPLSVPIAESDNFTQSDVFDYSGSPITKAELVAEHGTLSYLGIVIPAGYPADASIGLNGQADKQIDFTIILNNFQMVVEYTSGPVQFTLTPPGGDVEPGQQITVEGPGAANQQYAALQGDKVIPIDPKVVDPDTVILEVPNPATDPCIDCLGDCTNCDECFDACNEDLTSAACQECMAACLECLEECLESLEGAEDCQESKQDPPDEPTEIVIICGGPPFDGSVPLGNFTIIVANGSGIYQFIEGKRNDTLYSAARDGSTYDVKIPNPGGKTGFFRS